MQQKNLSELTRTLTSSIESDQSMDAVTVSALGYFELEQIPVREIDLYSQIESKLDLLEDMTSKLSFQMREVRYLLKM